MCLPPRANGGGVVIEAASDDDSEGPIARREPDGISSLCGLPAITVPCGFSKDNLPFGVQFIGRALNDHAVIAAARISRNIRNGTRSGHRSLMKRLRDVHDDFIAVRRNRIVRSAVTNFAIVTLRALAS